MDKCIHCGAELVLEAEIFFEECQACAKEANDEMNSDIERDEQ